MYAPPPADLDSIFKNCRSLIDQPTWQQVTADHVSPETVELIPDRLDKLIAAGKIEPGYLADLARLEAAVHQAEHLPFPNRVDSLDLNPSLQLVELGWHGLDRLLTGDRGALSPPDKTPQRLLVWRESRQGQVSCRPATDEDLLVLKLVLEGIDPQAAATIGNVSTTAILDAIDRAKVAGLLLAPPSRLRRDPACFTPLPDTGDRYLATEIFTLQWHVTQKCDLHCRHCYDRSERSPMSLVNGLELLDDMADFCAERNVRGQVTFTGGNPLLYPEFVELYRAAVDHGFIVALLGNPAPRRRIEELIAIQMPAFFQVSLEGLAAHNDYIRGRGHFQRVLSFLDLLKELDVYSMVMLTLTADNIDQVLPLGKELRNRTDMFVFNRLAMVGEGARLTSVPPENYETFLRDYLAAAVDNPVLALKDNLINIIRHRDGNEPFGGCAGFGCGAAFNFLSVLPDGEAHACRKLPSMIGNVFTDSLATVYDSPAAKRYRQGSTACQGCAIRTVCGGCLAVGHGFGRDIFTERDPYCFMNLSG